MLREERILALARGWLETLLPHGFMGRFFLVGGAFKTAIHERPPADLDLWPVSEKDRCDFLAALVAGGAVVTKENAPYQTALRAAGRVVEVAWKCEPTILGERLERADLGMAAVGVEWVAGALRAEIHPCAHASVAAREVRVIRPLLNWRYALATIERGRRYAAELGYVWPEGEEAFLWETFDRQDPEMQAGMIERYKRVGRQIGNVLEHARARARRG